jgi:hypothetical protein
MASDIVLVVRSSDERTVKFSTRQRLNQFPGGNIQLVREQPFEVALRKCYEIGHQSRAKWLITLDADIFVLPGALRKLVAIAEEMPDYYFQTQGRIFDKIFGTYRPAGSRVYRVSLLGSAIKNMPEVGSEIRPETATLKRMGALGHPSRLVGLVTGIHDYEQFYCDLYRKAFVHGQKHSYLAADLLKRCLKKKEVDHDFAVIFKGFCDGISSAEKATIDANRFRGEANAALIQLGLTEKPGFEVNNVKDWDLWVLSQLEFEPLEFVSRDRPPSAPERLGIKKRFDENLKKNGFFAAAKYSIGAAFEKIGKSLKNLP